ncbi:MAG: SPFH domain-containing protein [Planctomycetota bacterium]|nr:SPFH domain-containing protein [Planctomycetota bacterium]
MKYFIASIALLVVAIVVTTFITEKIPPARIGVKQVVLGPSKGIVEQDHYTGLVLGISGYHRWHLLPRQTHFLHFTSSKGWRESKLARGIEDWQPAIQLRTNDGNTIGLDVTVTYRIREGEAYMIIKDGLKAAYRERVRASVIGTLREELAQLTSEDLQITDKRLKRAEATLKVLKDELAIFHVVPENLFIRKVKFPAQYEIKLQEKQLLRQESQLESALTEQARVEQDVKTETRKIAAAALAAEKDWDRKIQEQKSNYQVQIAQINAEAYLYAQTTIAEGEAERDIAEARGNLALEKAGALRDSLRNTALDSEGGRILLALEAVKNLQIPEVILNSDDPAVPMLLDLSKMTRLLVGEREPTTGGN